MMMMTIQAAAFAKSRRFLSLRPFGSQGFRGISSACSAIIEDSAEFTRDSSVFTAVAASLFCNLAVMKSRNGLLRVFSREKRRTPSGDGNEGGRSEHRAQQLREG